MAGWHWPVCHRPCLEWLSECMHVSEHVGVYARRQVHVMVCTRKSGCTCTRVYTFMSVWACEYMCVCARAQARTRVSMFSKPVVVCRLAAFPTIPQ